MKPAAIVSILNNLSSPIEVRLSFFHNFRFMYFRPLFWAYSMAWDYFRKFLVDNSSNFQYFFMRPDAVLGFIGSYHVVPWLESKAWNFSI